MKNNAYFDELDRAGQEWTEKRNAHRQLKTEIVKKYGWSSDELKAWYAEHENMEFSYSQGACKAYRAWKSSTTDELEMSDYLWETEYQDFVDALRQAGIHSFVVTDHSTALMPMLHGLAAAGCRMEGLCTLTKTVEKWSEPLEEQVQGIRFTL